MGEPRGEHPEEWPPFARKLADEATPLHRSGLQTVQVNIGKLCNQTCKHCHVDAGPWRTENMTGETVDHVLAFAEAAGASIVDITGGAPEMNPHFRRLVSESRAAGRHVMDRCNLTVLFEEGQEDTAEFLAENQVEVVASLPCYLEDNVDKQRGSGVFERSIEGLRKLNALGYGQGGELRINLVYNPVGAHLPPPQEKLQADYKRELGDRFGIVFDSLFCMTNMPIHRYAAYLKRLGEYQAYMKLLVENFNPSAVGSVMCATMVSVGWDGYLYDCDFNQMLEMKMQDERGPMHISDVTPQQVLDHLILVDDHCYGCTAGAGSSCGGEVV